MNKINVLMVSLRADHGGGPKHVDLLLRHLPSNFRLFLACPKDKPYYDNWRKNPEVHEIYVLPHRQFSIFKFLGLVRFCKRNKIDIIHSHGKGAGIYSRLVKIFLPKIKVVHTFHGVHIAEYGAIKKQMYIIYERTISLLTNKIINVSEGERNICLHYNLFKRPKSEVIYNGIPPLNKVQSVENNLFPNRFIVTTLSRFDYPKNMYLAYEIAKKLSRDKRIVFIWIGDGSDKEGLQNIAIKENMDNIYFAGFRENIAEFLSFSNVYLSTSRWEGLPYALIEAAALALPIVASDVVGNNEVVQHEQNGFLFDINAPDAAAGYIETLVNDSVLYQKISQDAYQSFLNKFQISTMVAKTRELYESL